MFNSTGGAFHVLLNKLTLEFIKIHVPGQHTNFPKTTHSLLDVSFLYKIENKRTAASADNVCWANLLLS